MMGGLKTGARRAAVSGSHLFVDNDVECDNGGQRISPRRSHFDNYFADRAHGANSTAATAHRLERRTCRVHRIVAAAIISLATAPGRHQSRQSRGCRRRRAKFVFIFCLFFVLVAIPHADRSSVCRVGRKAGTG